MNEPAGTRADAFDPDTPTEAVGSLPSIDINAIGLPRPAWAFVAGALVVGLLRLGAIGGHDVTVIVYRFLTTLEAVAVCLLPAALLLRAPDAGRAHPVLLGGLGLGAGAEIVRAILAVGPLPFELASAWSGPLLRIATIAEILGIALVGIGLMRLCSPSSNRQTLLAGIAGAYVLLAFLPVVILASSGVDVANDPSAILQTGAYALATAFTTWVAVAAWLDRAGPRRFWALLAAALPLGLATRLVAALATFATLGPSPATGQVAYLALIALLGATTACFALVAYVRFTPVGEAGGAADRPMATILRRLSGS